MSTTYRSDLSLRWAIEHGAPTEPPLDVAVLAASHPCNGAEQHGDRVPSVCAEARRLLAGVRCGEPCCSDFVGFAELVDGDAAVCTNVSCATCWPDECPECGDAAGAHTDGGCIKLPDETSAEIDALTTQARGKVARYEREGRELEQLRTELVEEPELRGPTGAKKRIRVEVLVQSREKAADELDAVAEKVGVLRARHRCKCQRSAAAARESKGHRWNERGGLVERAA